MNGGFRSIGFNYNYRHTINENWQVFGEAVYEGYSSDIKESDIKGDLFTLCHNKITGRSSAETITLFKSVGHALEDLAAAQLLYKHLVSN